jgi:hypothetical protein
MPSSTNSSSVLTEIWMQAYMGIGRPSFFKYSVPAIASNSSYPPLTKARKLACTTIMKMASRGRVFTICIGVFFFLSTTSAALRFWVRLRIQKRFGLDDWLLLVSLVQPSLFSIQERHTCNLIPNDLTGLPLGSLQHGYCLRHLYRRSPFSRINPPRG